MKRFRQSARTFASEQLQRLALRGGREREETEIRLLPTRLHHLVQPVFPVRHFLVALAFGRRTENGFQLPRGLPALAGMRLVHTDGVTPLRNLSLPLGGFGLLFGGGIFLFLCSSGM